MKRILLMLAALLSCVAAWTQDQEPKMVREGAQWVYYFSVTHFDPESQNYTYFTVPAVIEIKGDTVVDGVNLKKCYLTLDEPVIVMDPSTGEKFTYLEPGQMLIALLREIGFNDVYVRYQKELYEKVDFYPIVSSIWDMNQDYYNSTPYDEHLLYRLGDGQTSGYYLDKYFSGCFIPATVKDSFFSFADANVEEFQIGDRTFLKLKEGRNCFTTCTGLYYTSPLRPFSTFLTPVGYVRLGLGSLNPILHFSHLVWDGTVVYKSENYLSSLDPTAIEGIKADSGNVDENYYDLNGRIVKEPASGIFIHGGKKIAIPCEKE